MIFQAMRKRNPIIANLKVLVYCRQTSLTYVCQESALFTYKSPWTYPCIPPSWVEAISIDINTIKRGRPEIRQKWRSIIHSKTGWKIASSFFWRKVLMSWQFLYNSTQKVYVENFHKYSQFSNSTLTRIPNCFWARNLTKFPFLFGMTFRPVTTGLRAKWRLS